MRGNLPAAIAWRYLRARKSHGAVSAIAIVSVVGVAVATAAIVCVLSVFNGFRGVLTSKLDLLAPDVVVAPQEGKSFASADSVLAAVRAVPGVALAMPVVCDNALIVAGSAEMPVLVKGVDAALYRRMTRADSILVVGGVFDVAGVERVVGEDEYGEPVTERRGGVVVSIGVASRMGISGEGSGALLFAPRRHGRVNMANPLASFVRDSVRVNAVFQTMQNDYDDNLVFTDLATASRLLEYDGEATSIEVAATAGTDPAVLAARISSALGDTFSVRDRARMQEVSFRMVEIEKWVTFLLLFFILVIASFNIVSTLTMLVIEKEPQMSTLRSLGMTRRAVGAVFGWESLFVTLTGGVTGMAAGVVLSLLQQHFGFIKLNGDPAGLVVTAYPVEVRMTDLLVVAVPVLVIGLLTAWIASRFAGARSALRVQGE